MKVTDFIRMSSGEFINQKDKKLPLTKNKQQLK